MQHSLEEVVIHSRNCSSFPAINFAFGSRLRQLRQRRNLCQVDLAWHLGITRNHLEDIESGFEPVDLAMLSRMSSTLSLGLSELLQGL